jgi:glutamate dehydrogenase
MWSFGIDWARGAASNLVPTDGWERMLAASIVYNFETMRFDLIRRLTPSGGDPLAAVEAWLLENATDVAALHATIQAARHSGTPTPAMLAHLASIAQSALAG